MQKAALREQMDSFFRETMESSDEEEEGEETEAGGTVTKTKHDLMLKTEV